MCLYASTPVLREHFKEIHGWNWWGCEGGAIAPQAPSSRGGGWRATRPTNCKARVLPLKQAQQVLDLCFHVLALIQGAFHLREQQLTKVPAQAVQGDA
jgi:hypothetical protein